MADEQTPGFTPGPWRRGQEGNLRIYGPDGRYEHSGLIAEVFPKNGAQTANAQLIASTPELLRALERVSKWIPTSDQCCDEDRDEIICLRADIAAAIRKARGR